MQAIVERHCSTARACLSGAMLPSQWHRTGMSLCRLVKSNSSTQEDDNTSAYDTEQCSWQVPNSTHVTRATSASASCRRICALCAVAHALTGRVTERVIRFERRIAANENVSLPLPPNNTMCVSVRTVCEPNTTDCSANLLEYIRNEF